MVLLTEGSFSAALTVQGYFFENLFSRRHFCVIQARAVLLYLANMIFIVKSIVFSPDSWILRGGL